MYERIVEDWLTKSGERGFETPFTQLLSLEGYRILQGPVHHPFEHGKDIIAYGPDGALYGFQLKGGDISLEGLERILPQLLALAGTAISYPGVEPPRRPDRAVLVTSGKLSSPARDRLSKFNDANRIAQFTIIEVVEREQLVGRFASVHGRFFPSEPHDLNALLRLYVGNGTSRFPVREFSAFLASTLYSERSKSQRVEAVRVLATAVLLTAYATASWQRAENSLAVAEGWITLCCGIMNFAATLNLDDESWRLSYDLAFTEVRRELEHLLLEAAERDDLVLPDIVEGIVYPTRALLVCGYLASFLISETYCGSEFPHSESVRRILLRELPFIRVLGEAAAPFIIQIATALELLGEAERGHVLVYSYAAGLAHANQRRSESALPDPYHDFDDVLRRTFGAEVPFPDERFDGNAYTLHVVIDWMARRGARNEISEIWPQVTRLTLNEFQVADPKELLARFDANGKLTLWHASAPESWARLRSESVKLKESELPGVLWRHLEILPYLLLISPHRFVRVTDRALDYLAHNLVDVEMDREDEYT